MRVDIVPLVRHAENLTEAVAAKSRSRASSCAHKLLKLFPDPTWAETAPGCAIYYNDEQGLSQAIEGLRYVALTWLRALIDPSRDWEPTAEWPEPTNLVEATRELAKYMPVQLEGIYLEEDGPVSVEV